MPATDVAQVGRTVVDERQLRARDTAVAGDRHLCTRLRVADREDERQIDLDKIVGDVERVRAAEYFISVLRAAAISVGAARRTEMKYSAMVEESYGGVLLDVKR